MNDESDGEATNGKFEHRASERSAEPDSFDPQWADRYGRAALVPPHRAPPRRKPDDREKADEKYERRPRPDPFPDPGGDLADVPLQRVSADGEPKGGGKDDKQGGGDDQKQEKKRWSTRKKVLVFGIVGLVLLAAIIAAVMWHLRSLHFESTDDAFIDAHYERVAPQVSGRVTEVFADDNAVVEANQVLFKIDPRDYQAALDQAKAAQAEARGNQAEAQAQREVALANVEQAKADVDSAQATLENATAQLERYQGLSREAVSPQRLDDLRTAERNARAQLNAQQKKLAAQQSQVTLADSRIEAAQAQQKSADARVEQAELNLSYTQVRATVGGRVTNRQLQVGDYVAPGQQLMVLVPRDVFITANFKETQLTDMRQGQPVTIKVDAFPDEDFRGHIDSFQAGSGQAFALLPPQNATGNYVKVVQRVPVKIVFDDRDGEAYRRLGPGMSVVPSVKVK